ncbi:hypothetical protein Vafri_16372 [Volvox africanus]|uniref:t-SNARE coiled-coil homology domain-containing protein n=1 Tax=Volvox africanus TaxID=51714 RepID=A0A8J4F6L7_9CHLO|nr:hypothetical protein Vafri_16372 [Volvox africanus]
MWVLRRYHEFLTTGRWVLYGFASRHFQCFKTFIDASHITGAHFISAKFKKGIVSLRYDELPQAREAPALVILGQDIQLIDFSSIIAGGIKPGSSAFKSSSFPVIILVAKQGTAAIVANSITRNYSMSFQVRTFCRAGRDESSLHVHTFFSCALQDLAKHGGRELSSYESQATREVEGLVFKLVSNVTQLRKMVDKLGTTKDTLDHRRAISDANITIQELAKSIKEKLTALHDGFPGAPGRSIGSAGVSSEQQLKVKRLLQDFASILQDYKVVQRSAAEREAASLPRQPARSGTAAKGSTEAAVRVPLLGADGGMLTGPAAASSTSREDDIEAAVRRQAQQQAEVSSLEDSVRYHEALIEERDAGIREIQRQIGEVNEMFQDLAVLISDQGEQLQTVDAHITSVAERVTEGQRELVTASRRSRAMRNKCLWLWLVAAVIVSVLLIILLA